MIRVFIFATSPVALAGLENLAASRAVRIIGTSANVETLADQVADAEPDVVLIDASNQPSERMFDALAESDLASQAPVVMILDDEAAVEKSTEALRAGIRSVLPRDVPPSQLIAALNAAAAGLVVLHPSETDALFPRVSRAPQALADLAEPLTRREREVLQMLASGLGNKQIAGRLGISEHTAKFHVASILGKLGAVSRTEAVSVGIRRGLVLL